MSQPGWSNSMRQTAWLAIGAVCGPAVFLLASCATAPRCGDGVVDAATCDADCTAPTCGDGHVNQAAGEACDSDGADTSDCDADCTAVACGDGHVNKAAGEQCETHPDCLGSHFCLVNAASRGCTCAP